MPTTALESQAGYPKKFNKHKERRAVFSVSPWIKLSLTIVKWYWVDAVSGSRCEEANDTIAFIQQIPNPLQSHL